MRWVCLHALVFKACAGSWGHDRGDAAAAAMFLVPLIYFLFRRLSVMACADSALLFLMDEAGVSSDTTEYAAMRSAVEAMQGSLRDKEAPSKSLVASKLEQLEDGAPVACGKPPPLKILQWKLTAPWWTRAPTSCGFGRAKALQRRRAIPRNYDSAIGL